MFALKFLVGYDVSASWPVERERRTMTKIYVKAYWRKYILFLSKTCIFLWLDLQLLSSMQFCHSQFKCIITNGIYEQLNYIPMLLKSYTYLFANVIQNYFVSDFSIFLFHLSTHLHRKQTFPLLHLT